MGTETRDFVVKRNIYRWSFGDGHSQFPTSSIGGSNHCGCRNRISVNVRSDLYIRIGSIEPSRYNVIGPQLEQFVITVIFQGFSCLVMYSVSPVVNSLLHAFVEPFQLWNMMGGSTCWVSPGFLL